MNNRIKYSVYGLIEPVSYKIVYISIYKYEMKNFPIFSNQYIEYSINEMAKNKNQCCRDLINMNKLGFINIINFDYYEKKEDANKLKEDMIKIFMPRYNLNNK